MIKKAYFHFLLLSILIMLSNPMKAQQNKLDSIVNVLSQLDLSKGIDTLKYNNLIKELDHVVLDESSIVVLENTISSISQKDNYYFKCALKLRVLYSLNLSDKDLAISYGRKVLDEVDQLKFEYKNFVRSQVLRALRIPFRTSNRFDEGFDFFNEKLKVFKLQNDSAGTADCYYVLSSFYRRKGLLEQAIYNLKKSSSYMDTTDLVREWGMFQNPLGRNTMFNNISVLGSYFAETENYDESVFNLKLAYQEMLKPDNHFYGNSGTFLGTTLLKMGITENALTYINESFQKNLLHNNMENLASGYQAMAFYNIKIDNLKEAELLLDQAQKLINENNMPVNSVAGVLSTNYYRALIREKQNLLHEAIELLQEDIKDIAGLRIDLLRDYKLLSSLYKRVGNFEQATIVNDSYILLLNEIAADQKKYGFLSYEIEQQIAEKELSISKLQSEKRISSLTRNFMIFILVLIFILALFLYSRYRAKKRDNTKLEKAFTQLKAAQSQLIQSEKMASLGELTAGIAHEIQNPLNFVNNFSEVSMELLDEMKVELNNGNTIDAKEIADDVIQNLEKINYHGKRADSIVKGMLLHSRNNSTASKESIDLNALCDEYLRLSYHGLRAKDKTFNAIMKTDFDPSVQNVEVIPQDIGRVFLNLFNNAFYAVNEKKHKNIEGFEPVVSVSTKRNGKQIEIKISDNGGGIPAHVVDKIFQPFFTTKPTGQGTGLGLSLSYDIITKGHGGELKVDTSDNDKFGNSISTTFTIVLNK